MKKRLLKIALLLLAVLTTGSVNAATETYDFSILTTGQYTASGTASCDKVNGQNMNLLKIGDETFDYRFAVSRAGTATADNAWETKTSSTHSGLFSCWDARYFTILGLHNGDRIKIVWSTESSKGASLKFCGQPALEEVSTSDAAVTSNSDYTVETDDESVNINLVTDKGSETKGDGTRVYIKSVTITTSSSSVPVTINVIPETYDFTTVDTGKKTVLPTWGTTVTSGGVELNMLAAGTETYDNRFAVGPTTRNTDAGNCFKFRNADTTYKGLYSQYDNRNISVLNLKAGDKVTFTISNNDETLRIVGGANVVSGQAITISADGNLDLVTTGGVYIERIKIEPSTGTYIGATLVSSYALDFTDVEGITAYVATAANAGSVTFSKVTKVEANTPLYIKANEESGSVINVNVPVATEGAVDYSSTNLLKGFASITTSLKSTGDTKYYVFGVKSDEAGFYPVSDSNTFTSAAGKAYLELNADQAGAARSIRMTFGDGSDITGINTAVVEKESRDDAWYTLQGARVSKPAHGIYIKNGKKIFVK